MTSQKRYRQHQDSNKSGPRFRDLPPRFKRQKSLSSSSPQTQPEATNTVVEQSSTIKRTEFSQAAKLPVQMAPSNSAAYPCEQHQVQPRSHTQVHQATASNASSGQWPQNNVFVTAPLESSHFSDVINLQSPHIPLGTHFGYKPTSPPLSPWLSTGVSGQVTGADSPSWLSTHNDPFASPRLQASPVYFSNENWAPNHNAVLHCNPDASWFKLQPHNTSPLPVVHSGGNPATKTVDRTRGSNQMQGSVRQVVDYSDPDIRTIEMLRELERVADEKESEYEESGVDRKSLVSHHLRMLMCAVDRYTEGIEDDLAMSSRSDEVSAASDSLGSTPRASPGLGDVNSQKQTKHVSEKSQPLWSANHEASVWKDQGVKPVATIPNLGNPAHGGEEIFQSQKTFPLSDKLENSHWDLWSSPSFDFSGVMTQSSEEITRNPFGRFREKDERDRKPLYQR